ncbi:MAG: hypothetical protein ACTHOR_00020 [Devosia sp.]
MRKLLVFTSILAFAAMAAPAVEASTTTPPPSSMSSSMTKMPSAAAQIALVKKAHSKALKNKDYVAALQKGDTAAAQKILVASGAPAETVVKINNTQKPGSTARPRVTISVTCCPLTITITIK